MKTERFNMFAADPFDSRSRALTERQDSLYERDSLRDCFYRDYTRILHASAFRRLKHKTQVFPHVENDHICTRMEHVLHVESVSTTIAEELGLNVHLTRAIALGHDLGHPPFGHRGEEILDHLSAETLGERFWHEKNGLRFVDDIELLEDPYRVERNLALTYAVRDGIISHCGEVDENGLRPRTTCTELAAFDRPGAMQSVTWEGCVVKLADKIAYIGRDIEDADALGMLGAEGREALAALQKDFHIDALNTTGLMHRMICDVVESSSPEDGICLSADAAELMRRAKELNYRFIYRHPRFEPFLRYSELVLTEVFRALTSAFTGEAYLAVSPDLTERMPTLFGGFTKFVRPYLDRPLAGYENRKLYGDLTDRRAHTRAVFDYVSGMTDAYLIRAYGELVNF